MNFTFSPEDLAYRDSLPRQADVVVIGGGVIGVTTAIYLRRKGLSVLLLEKGHVAGEQSSRNWGWIRTQGRDLAEVPISLEARALWAALDQDTGGATGLRTIGVTYLAGTDSEMARFTDWVDSAQGFGLGTRLLSSAETAQVLPGALTGFSGAMHTPSDMCAEPWVAVPALARVAAREGALIREGCAARGLVLSAGRVSGVVTEVGEVACDAVVLAGGAWSSLFLRRHGVSIPQLSVRSNVVATRSVTGFAPGAVVARGWATRPRADGGVTIAPSGFNDLFVGPDAFRALPKYWPAIRQGTVDYHLKPLAPKGFPDHWATPRRWAMDGESPFERMRVLNPEPNHAALDKGIARARAVFGDPPVAEQRRWAGMIDAMPDIVPVVDTVAALPGLTVATGMCGHGFGIGPAFGRITADLVTGDAPGHDLSRFRLGRFSDGSPIVLGPDI